MDHEGSAEHTFGTSDLEDTADLKKPYKK